MKSMASSIQPNFAAISTRHCSRVTVRYHGTAGVRCGVAAAGELMGDTYYKKGLRPLGPEAFSRQTPCGCSRTRISKEYETLFKEIVDVCRCGRQGARFHAAGSGPRACLAQRAAQARACRSGLLPRG